MTKIVIIDDHPVVRDGMSAMLENESDFSVVCSAKSGEDAVDFVRKHGEPSIVVSDIRMPGMDGFETLAKLKRFYPSIRVLLLAGMPLKVEEEKARAEGARGYLPKASTGSALSRRYALRRRTGTSSQTTSTSRRSVR